MRKLLTIILILFVFTLFAGEARVDKDGFTMNGAAGSITVNGNSYTQMRLMPELVFGKFGIGLDIDILIDKDGNVRREDWDEAEDYLNKILYIRYGRRGDKVYGKIGSFSSYTLGHGLIMRNYTNMLKYPEYRQIGLMLGGQLPYYNTNVEGFSSNIKENNILAGRVTSQPLSVINFPIISKIKLGASFATDRNQYEGLDDVDNDNYADVFDDFPNNDDYHDEIEKQRDYYEEIYEEIAGTTEGFEEWFDSTSVLPRNPSLDELPEEDVQILGLDYQLPLIERELFELGNYGEYAKIIDHGDGFIFPGFYSKFLIFYTKLEFRYYGNEFEPEFFNELYDENRINTYSVDSDSVYLETKSATLADNKISRGWFGSITADLKIADLTIEYEDMYGDDIANGKSIWGVLSLKRNLIPKINTARVSYEQRRVENVLTDWRTPSTLIRGKAGYAVGENTALVADYSERYKDLNNDGEIKGDDEVIKNFGIGVEFTF